MFVERRRRGMSERFRRAGTIAWSLIGILVLGLAAVFALFQVREVFPPLVLALLTIFLLNPVVSRLEREGVPRIAGSCLTYTVMLAAVGVALIFIIPLLAHQFTDFVRDFPHTADRIADFAERQTRLIQRRFPSFDIGTWISGQIDTLGESAGRVAHFLVGAFQTFFLLLLGPIIAFYLLVDLPRLQRSAMALIPPDHRPEVTEVSREVSRTMGNYFRGQLFVAFIVGVMSSIGMLVIGLPYWLVVGLVAGLFNMIPLVGPYIGAIPGILIAGAFGSPVKMLLVAGVMTLVQQIDNHFISPNVMRLTVRLHPATVMGSLIVAATLAGIWGMLLAVPAVASAKVLFAHLWRTRVPWGHELFDAPETVSFEVPSGGVAPEQHGASSVPDAEPDGDAQT